MRVDHLVWYSADLATGEKHFSGWTDVAPAFGGAHPGQGTRNSVLSLGDSTYIEILARDRERMHVGFGDVNHAHRRAGRVVDAPALRQLRLAPGDVLLARR